MISIKVVLNKILHIINGKGETEKETLSPSSFDKYWFINEFSVEDLIFSMSSSIAYIEGESEYKDRIRFDDHPIFYDRVIQRLKSLGESAVREIIPLATNVFVVTVPGDYGNVIDESKQALAAIKVLGDLGSRTAVPALLKAIEHKYASNDQKKAAVNGLRKLDGGEAVYSGLVKVKPSVKDPWVSLAVDMLLSNFLKRLCMGPMSSQTIIGILNVLGPGPIYDHKALNDLIYSIDIVKSWHSSDASIVKAANEAVTRLTTDHTRS